MASTWGSAWGVSWGVSWDIASAPAQTAPPQYGGGGRRALKGTGNYVHVPEPPVEVAAPERPKAKPAPRPKLTALDRELVNALRLAEAKRIASEEIARAEQSARRVGDALERLEANLDRLEDDELEAVLLMLLVAA